MTFLASPWTGPLECCYKFNQKTGFARFSSGLINIISHTFFVGVVQYSEKNIRLIMKIPPSQVLLFSISTDFQKSSLWKFEFILRNWSHFQELKSNILVPWSWQIHIPFCLNAVALGTRGSKRKTNPISHSIYSSIRAQLKALGMPLVGFRVPWRWHIHIPFCRTCDAVASGTRGSKRKTKHHIP